MPYVLGVWTAPEGSAAVERNIISPNAWNAFINDVATALSTAVLKDGSQTFTTSLSLSSQKITSLAAGTALTDAMSLNNAVSNSGRYATVTGVDTIVATVSPAWTAYAAGQSVQFHAAGANTGPATINVSGLGAKALTKNGTTALSAGDIPSGSLVFAMYDGTRFVMKV